MDGTYDVLILGGGITGAGVALDAALRGWRVGLIDKGDFASGTSSVSSKLVHGGLRYLEQGAFHLVYEALHERGLLLRNAPHLVHPLRFFMPIHRDGRLPTWKCRLGLTLYDLLAGRDNIRRSRPVSVHELVHTCTGLKATGLRGGAEFYDAQMDDARLCIEVLLSVAERGATLANYAEAVGFDMSEGRIDAVRVHDHVSQEEGSIRARLVLNATGPWVDQVCRLAGDPSGPHLQPTKGVHLVVPERGLPVGLFLLHPRDGRVFFVLPWMGKTLLGTTDTFTTAGPDSLTVDPADVAYILDGFNFYFEPSLGVDDVLGSFVGLRPLLRSSSAMPSSLSREAKVWQAPSGMVSAAGGKFTTYRRLAQTITDELARLLGRRGRCRTMNFPLAGAPREPWHEFLPKMVTTLCQRFTLPEPAARHLAQRYGRRALDVAAYLNLDPANRQPIRAGEPDLHAELAYQRDHEMAVFEADHLLRRTRLGLFGKR